MKSVLHISLLLLLVLGCKKDDADGPVNSFATGLEGRWKLVETEKGVVGNQGWVAVPGEQADYLIFRSDGVLIDSTGLPACCSPIAFIINQKLFEIKPQAPLAANPACSSRNCVLCPTWDIQYSGNELVVSYCDSPRRKYVRG
ncbi:hypothetical protein DYBT9275_01234 [Dyadobacter sp. CECT 9275]|uniref:Lipocalin-like domain-containing protein n=1 Tax=Dyadobacter helix TaxID=2822344 RepID=A0A916J9X4_9BACT|nr:hypothetical protein [Dyadobacter sp. CECT 9275]CAG4993786.1 hypothetical protein DYBT9275_01234 [Dyadobacter sp. CECT 9275]